MGALQVLDARAVRGWLGVAVEELAAAREEIDALNVYPVPDRDTGTNLYLTVEAAAVAVQRLPADSDLGSTVRACVHGALIGARGNSGIILSQLIRGMATAAASGAGVDGRALAAGIARAEELGYSAVARPVEGTMLTVIGAAARAAGAVVGKDASADAPLAAVARAAAAAARAALAATPEQLPELARAGVVDAGGRGLSVLLDALVSVVTGVRDLPAPLRLPTLGAAQRPVSTVDAPGRGQTADDTGSAIPAFEVMYLLDAEEPAAAALRDTLADIGDSVVVVGGERLWNVHVHANDAGAAVEAGIAAGRPHRVRITSLDDVSAALVGREHATRGRAVVAVVAGDGLAALVREAGALSVPVCVGQQASTEALLQTIAGTRAREVVVLPNDSLSLALAEAVAASVRRPGLRIGVVPSTATVQALAALAVHDSQRAFDDDLVQMTAAAGHTRHGAVTTATSQAMTAAGPCRAGDVLGAVNGDFVIIGDDEETVARAVLDRLLDAGGELVTLVRGAGGSPHLADRLGEHVERHHRGVDTVVYDGGQERYPILVGVE